MARKYGRLMITAWEDSDFTALTTTQQMVYSALYSSRDITWCGVLPLLYKRLAGLASDLTEARARAAMDALERGQFIVIDRDTAEVCVRRFIHHDEVMKQPNVAKAMGRAYYLVRSPAIKECIVAELARELTDYPDYPGWASLAGAYPELDTLIQLNPYPKGYRKATPNPSRKGSGKGLPTTYNPQPSTLNPSGADADADASLSPETVVTSVGG